MSKRLEEFSKNKNELYLFFIGLVLLGFHIYQFIDSGFQVYPLIRVIGFSIMIPCIVFIGQKSVPYILLPFALALGQTISFENYTPFIMIFICCVMKKSWSPYIMGAYLLDAVIVCVRHEKSPIHLCVHIGNCIVLYSLIMFSINSIKKSLQLQLTEDERYILNEIVYNEKKLKEIEGHKQNTVSKKLKKCRDKNNCKDNEELYQKYKSSMYCPQISTEQST